MGDEEGGAPYLWVSAEPLLEGVEEAPSGPYVKAPGKCVRRRGSRALAHAASSARAGAPWPLLARSRPFPSTSPTLARAQGQGDVPQWRHV